MSLGCPFSLEQIQSAAERIKPFVNKTPLVRYHGVRLPAPLNTADVFLKLEILQRTGSFKARGAVNVVQQLNKEQKAAGITAFSAGNHAIATAYAARVSGVSAKVAMPSTANPYRVQQCRHYGAEIVFAENIAALLNVVEQLQAQEGRTLVHPFEGINTSLGCASLGLEWAQESPQLDAIVVPVGGGGLISGIASAFKLVMPECKVYGVEPEGAMGMYQSLKLGKPVSQVDINTIADSLGAPLHMPYSFSVVQQVVDEMVTVSDKQLVETMCLMFEDLKFAVEPAGAAALAALCGPLRDRLVGKKVGVIACGSNIDTATFFKLIS